MQKKNAKRLRLLHSADAFAKGGAFDRSANHETASVKTNRPFRGCEESLTI